MPKTHSIPPKLVDTGVRGYLVILVENYLSQRTLWYETDEDPKEYIVTAAIPQSSVLAVKCHV